MFERHQQEPNCFRQLVWQFRTFSVGIDEGLSALALTETLHIMGVWIGYGVALAIHILSYSNCLCVMILQIGNISCI